MLCRCRTPLTSFVCFYLFFFGSRQETLKKMREIDDKIIYALNTSIPTESFKGQLSASETCKDLHGKLTVVHEDRCKLIKNCIAVTADKLKDLKAQKDDANAYKNFKSEQRKVNLFLRFDHICQVSWLTDIPFSFLVSFECFNPNWMSKI